MSEKNSQQDSRLRFVKTLPSPKIFDEDVVLIYDRRLSEFGFAKWIKRFKTTYAVSAGESLKDIRGLPQHIEALMQLTQAMSTRHLTLVVAGGGSVGDFGGFIASVFKRGVRLVHVPTTWLAALDSSHGGKTALNVNGVKNQIGTFYPAHEIYIVESVLRRQPHVRAQEAAGELVKMALLDGGEWVRRLEKSRGRSPQLMHRFLPSAIQAKYRIVRRDPDEKNGLRQLLNLGHTFGHVLEGACQLPHGVAVAQGTFFAIDWSFKLGFLSLTDYQRATDLMIKKMGLPLLKSKASRLRRTKAKQLLRQDKKRDARDEVTFIFLKGIGNPIRESVSIESVLNEAKRQGWIQ